MPWSLILCVGPSQMNFQSGEEVNLGEISPDSITSLFGMCDVTHSKMLYRLMAQECLSTTQNNNQAVEGLFNSI
jgi:hypothetical protein